MTAEILRGFRAEVLKLRRLPLVWIALLGGGLIAGFVFVIHLLKMDDVGVMSANPWPGFLGLGVSVFGVFVAPFFILQTGGLVQLEHTASSWKYLYSLPLRRNRILLPKMLMAFSLAVLLVLLFGVFHLLGGYLLGLAAPEYGFQHHAPEFMSFFERLARLLVSGLGVVAVQFCLGMIWRAYLVPLTIGFIGFLISMLAVGKTGLAFLVPYCYPVFISMGMGGSAGPGLGLEWWGPLLNVEWYSLATVLLFTGLSLAFEGRRNITV
jgi:hypothetical protein